MKSTQITITWYWSRSYQWGGGVQSRILSQSIPWRLFRVPRCRRQFNVCCSPRPLSKVMASLSKSGLFGFGSGAGLTWGPNGVTDATRGGGGRTANVSNGRAARVNGLGCHVEDVQNERMSQNLQSQTHSDLEQQNKCRFFFSLGFMTGHLTSLPCSTQMQRWSPSPLTIYWYFDNMQRPHRQTLSFCLLRAYGDHL